jgi:hypothetical protein
MIVRIVAASLGIAASISTAAAFQGGKTPCSLPFENIATRPDPAASCRFEGCFSNDGKKFEDLAKNNFCQSFSSPTDLDNFDVFRTLQARNDPKNAGDRHQLRAIKPLGEGSIVRLATFIKEAHVSDCEGGESVNCDKPGFVNNDIHIPLVQNPADDECFSVTAEMSPHFRPEAWSQIDAKTPVNRLVRITGPLFYDSSHTPCKFDAGKRITVRNKPNRLSLWEIHPVYAIEVCNTKAGTDCRVGDKTNWLAYDKWVALPGVEVVDTGKDSRDRCPAPGAPTTCAGTVSPPGGGAPKHK